MASQATQKFAVVDFDHHDQSVAGSVHEIYAELRATSPLAWTESHGGYWIATGYEHINSIARDPENFSTRAGLIPDTTGGNPLVPIMLDDPEHRHYRTLLKDWFTPRRIASFEPVIRELAQSLLDDLPSPAELASAFALPLPLNMILRVIGVHGSGMDEVQQAVCYFIEHAGDDPTGSGDAFQGAIDFINANVVQALKQEPGDDLISYLISRQSDVDNLDDEMIARIGLSIIGAGFDTTYKSLASSLAYLAQHAEVQARARLAPSSRVVEELLRIVAPVSGGRLVLRDIEVGGYQLRKGERVLLSWPSANRDEDEFNDPHEADFDRPANQHVTFGVGIHRCLGMHLARLELRVAFEEIFKAYRAFHIAPGAKAIFSQGHTWGASVVPVEFQRA